MITTQLSELNEDQRAHLVYRLDHNTSCGWITAMKLAKLECGDMGLVYAFKKYGSRSDKSATILARKVLNFKLDPKEKQAREVTDNLMMTILRSLPALDREQSLQVLTDLQGSIKNTIPLYEV